MNTFLLGGRRLPLPLVMIGFMVGIVGLFLPIFEWPSPEADAMLLLVIMAGSLLLLTVLYAYCQLRQTLDEYLDAEVYSIELMCKHQISHREPVSYSPQEQALLNKMGQLQAGRTAILNAARETDYLNELYEQRQATIGQDTIYEGEEGFEEPDYNAMAHEYEQERYHGDAPKY